MNAKDLEGQLKAADVRLEQAQQQQEEHRKHSAVRDNENAELLSHLDKLRKKQNEHTLTIESLNGVNTEADVATKQMVGVACQYLGDFEALL